MKSMKISFFVIISLLICSNMWAQLPVSFGAKVGMNLSEIQKLDDDVKVGFNIGVTAELTLPSDFFLLSGLEFTTKGAKAKYDGIYSYGYYSPYDDEYVNYERNIKGKTTMNAMYLQLPIHVGYRFSIAPGTNLIVHLGPYFAYGIGGKVKGDLDINIDGTVVREKVDSKFFDSANRFDFGIGGAVGVEFLDKINVSLGADQGLTKVFKDTSTKNRCAYISVGYKFF